MAPVVIDLTSSPEPEDSPASKDGARAALQAFRSRKQKQASQRETESVDDNGDARTALAGFRPRKEKVDGISKPPTTPFGVFVPLIPNEEQSENIHPQPLQHFGHVPSRRAVQLIQPTHNTVAQSPYRSPLPKPLPVQEERVEGGSLASLLRQQTTKEELKERFLARVRQSVTTTSSLTPSTADSQPNGRLSIRRLPTGANSQPLVGKVPLPANYPVAGKQSQAILRAPNGRAAEVRQSIGASARFTENMALIRDGRHLTTSAPAEPTANAGHVDTESARPLKRRRIAPHVAAAILPETLGTSNGPPPKSQTQTATPASSSSASLSEAFLAQSATPTDHERSFQRSNAPDSPAPAPVVTKASRRAQNEREDGASPSLPQTLASMSVTPAVTKQGTEAQNAHSPRRQRTSVPKGSPKAEHITPESSNSTASSQLNRSPPVSLKKFDAGIPPDVKASRSHKDEYTVAEDALLLRLKETDNLTWKEIEERFQGKRSRGSLQVRYCTKLKRRNDSDRKPKLAKRNALPASAHESPPSSADIDNQLIRRPQRQRRNNGLAATDGLISWTKVKELHNFGEHQDLLPPKSATRKKAHNKASLFAGERAYPKLLTQTMRERELGTSRGQRSWAPSTRFIPDELKEHVFDSIGPRKYFQGTSGDAMCLAWAPNGTNFGVGSVAITDERSMQYNRPCNLLLGNCDRGLQELPEHHIRRPDIKSTTGNVNALHSMRESQDPRLFMTIASVQFSPDGKTLFSAGTDCKVRAYAVQNDSTQSAECMYELDHPNPLDLLSVSNNGIVATACHQSADDSIGIFKGRDRMLSLSPSRIEQQTERAIYPSALEWGVATHHSNLLLAGFSIDSTDEERNIAGETCLWDVNAEARIGTAIGIAAVTRNVFDVAWNPTPSSASTVFAVASARGLERVSKGMRSIVQCFAPKQNKAARVLVWECPAFDINDVIYCQHDTNLIAAGATDGKVYVWDQRFADRSNTPLHTLAHGDTLNVLDRDREREIADTGVRFVQWGPTSSRLYSGSSDGVVKVWNPYRAAENAHIKDIATFTSAVMSGAFSSDCRDLLIGEDQGRVNLLSVGYEHKAVRSMQKFELQSAPTPVQQHDQFAPSRQLLDSGKLVTKRMGDLPKRQAVQGPDYQGPYYAPTIEAVKAARHEYQCALDDQNVAHSKVAVNPSEDDNDATVRSNADQRVQEAQGVIQSMELRLDEAPILEAKAQANQIALLRRRKKAHWKDVSEPCQLDCNYLPATIDEGEVPDSRRSELRIPSALRSTTVTQVADLTGEELIEAGLFYMCISCSGPASRPKRGKLALCEQCHNKRNGLTSRCERCSAPIRPPPNPADQRLCEKCDFACFRCAKQAFVSEDASFISCESCGLAWTAGVLGYEVLRDGTTFKGLIGSGARLRLKNGDSSNEINELADAELEHYASLWQ